MVDNLQAKRPLAIDFDFIHQLEGGSLLLGYVSKPDSSKNGVKIAAGFDLGGKNPNDLRMLGLNATLVGKLYPYLGRQGLDAQAYVMKFPLTISVHEAAAINSGVALKLAGRLTEGFNADSAISFNDLPSCWQTVIASIEFQHGNLSRYCPVFWNWVVHQKWDKALLELKDFGDQNSRRRDKEADYIVAHSKR